MYLALTLTGLGKTECPFRRKQWIQLAAMKQGDKCAETGSSMTTGSPAMIFLVAIIWRPPTSSKCIPNASDNGGKTGFRSHISKGHFRHSSSSSFGISGFLPKNSNKSYLKSLEKVIFLGRWRLLHSFFISHESWNLDFKNIFKYCALELHFTFIDLWFHFSQLLLCFTNKSVSFLAL